jgi:hypothetical protein
MEVRARPAAAGDAASGASQGAQRTAKPLPLARQHRRASVFCKRSFDSPTTSKPALANHWQPCSSHNRSGGFTKGSVSLLARAKWAPEELRRHLSAAGDTAARPREGRADAVRAARQAGPGRRVLTCRATIADATSHLGPSARRSPVRLLAVWLGRLRNTRCQGTPSNALGRPISSEIPKTGFLGAIGGAAVRHSTTTRSGSVMSPLRSSSNWRCSSQFRSHSPLRFSLFRRTDRQRTDFHDGHQARSRALMIQTAGTPGA